MLVEQMSLWMTILYYNCILYVFRLHSFIQQESRDDVLCGPKYMCRLMKMFLLFACKFSYIICNCKLDDKL
jgi:hypothetical protein